MEEKFILSNDHIKHWSKYTFIERNQQVLQFQSLSIYSEKSLGLNGDYSTVATCWNKKESNISYICWYVDEIDMSAAFV